MRPQEEKQGVDHRDFDALTRSAMAEGGTRRALLRLLAGSALGSFVARIGLGDVNAAKPKQQKANKKRRRPTQAERKRQDQLQAERKGKGKGKPGKKKPKPKPPQGCTETFCDNGGRCCGGSCAAPGDCCPSEKKCGGGCIAATTCCPYDERTCPDGSCVGLDACCPGEKECAGGLCISVFECCPDARMCDDGSCVAAGKCCPDERLCPNDWCAPADECCPGRKPCADGSCVPLEHCCPDHPHDPVPLCANCHYLECDDGEYVCRKELAYCTCPAEVMVCPNAPARSWPLPDGGSINLSNGCCPWHHLGWDPATGAYMCLEEPGGQTGWICRDGW